MTRFTTVWVENGEPVVPVQVMRLDESLHDPLDTKLERLDAEVDVLPKTGTYR